MNKYPVIFLSFKGVPYGSHESFLEHLNSFFAFEFRKYRYLLNCDDFSKEDKLTLSKLLAGAANEA